MEMQIEAAVEHGVNVFIYDWYWYDDRPFLEQCLNNGFLRARNNHKMKFYLMWANHTATTLWDKRTAHLDIPIWDGAVDRKTFDKITDRMIDKYFTHPSYYKIGNKPVLMIYDIRNLVRGLGGVEKVKDAFADFDRRARAAGFDGVHFQAVLYRVESMKHKILLDGEPMLEAISRMGFHSATHYQTCGIVNVNRDYAETLPDIAKEWKRLDEELSLPFYPGISVGWDTQPRFLTPKNNVCKNNTPEEVKKGFLMARDYVDGHPNLEKPLIIINSWNEWTETSYLQPCDRFGYGYLEVCRAVFGDK